MKQNTFSVIGMKCENCKASVGNAIKGLKGVNSVEVSLQQGNVNVTYDDTMLCAQDIKAAVEAIGRFELVI